MNRRRGAVCGLALVVVTMAPGVAIGAAARSGAAGNPVDRFLDRSRHALEDYEFRGAVELRWRAGKRRHAQRIDVKAVDGSLRMDDGRFLQSDGRAWVRSDDRWNVLWGDGEDEAVPSLAGKYRVRTGAGPRILDRSTRMLVVRRDGRVVERVVADRDTGIVLARVHRDPWARREISMRFVALTDVHPRHGDGAEPSVAGAPSPASVPETLARDLGDGFALVDARNAPGGVQARYSDGVFDVSVFARDGALDWNALPAGGENVRLGSIRTRRYRTAAGSVVVWEANRWTYTCVTEATDRDQVTIVRAVSRERDSGWTQAVRFLSAPFRWF